MIGGQETIKQLREERDALSNTVEELISAGDRVIYGNEGSYLWKLAREGGRTLTLHDRIDELEDQLSEAEEERDMLAAHVERWKQWLGQDVEDDAGDWMDEGWSIANEAPATSLARLKAEWQAEALEEFRQKHTMPHMQNQWLKNAVAAYRRQAEGGEE